MTSRSETERRGCRRRLRALFVAGCILAVVGALASAASGAAWGLRTTGTGPVTLRTGDQLVVSGSKLRCAVSTEASASHPSTLVCGIGNLQSPLPGTYALAFADEAVLVIKSSASRQPALVTRKPQPAAAALFPAVSRKPTSFTVRPGSILLLGGSDVLCSVSSQAGTPTLTCGLGAGGSGTFVIGSYVGIVSQRLAVLTKLLAANRFVTVVSRKQP